jgi:hypothetical protein
LTDTQGGIDKALERLQASAEAVARAVDPFVNGGMSFTPKRSEMVEAVLRDFERASERYHEALRVADRHGGGEMLDN